MKAVDRHASDFYLGELAKSDEGGAPCVSATMSKINWLSLRPAGAQKRPLSALDHTPQAVQSNHLGESA